MRSAPLPRYRLPAKICMNAPFGETFDSYLSMFPRHQNYEVMSGV
jgi:hypothetical protein